jgi:hypothetical protein
MRFSCSTRSFEKFHTAVKKFRTASRRAPKTRDGLLDGGSGSLGLLERRAFAREHRELGVHREDDCEDNFMTTHSQHVSFQFVEVPIRKVPAWVVCGRLSVLPL